MPCNNEGVRMKDFLRQWAVNMGFFILMVVIIVGLVMLLVYALAHYNYWLAGGGIFVFIAVLMGVVTLGDPR